MITYNPAFDLYHCIYRMAHIAQCLSEKERFEIDKVRIWDFFLLFPEKLYGLSIKRSETSVKKARSAYIKKTNNPYAYSGDNRKLLEWMRPIQITALNCLVSYGILNKEEYLSNCVCVDSQEKLNAFLEKTGAFSLTERNTLSFLSLFSRYMPLSGSNGLKARTQLLESKYDAE